MHELNHLLFDTLKNNLSTSVVYTVAHDPSLKARRIAIVVQVLINLHSSLPE